MLGKLKSLLAPLSSQADTADPAPFYPPIVLPLREAATWPIPDWEQLYQDQPEGPSADTLDTYWCTTAYNWLIGMAARGGADYRVRQSQEFFLLSSMKVAEAEAHLRFCENAKNGILSYLNGLADDQGYGKHVVIVFDSEDEYYEYISNYYPDEGVFAMSGGMFINSGYGHFVTYAQEMQHTEPVLVHELTHCLVAHLPLPAWLNEGIAVNLERRVFPHLNDPSAQLYFPHEMEKKHNAFWNADTIQEFWSGKSFLRPDVGNMLSYDLARIITSLAARDYDVFRRFASAAEMSDAGLSAEHELGVELKSLVAAVIGEGPWRPDPSRWDEGIERGQF